jgi:hypothetical protein
MEAEWSMRKLDEVDAIILLVGLIPAVSRVVAAAEVHRWEDNEPRAENAGLYAYWDSISSEIMEPLLNLGDDSTELEKWFSWFELCLALGDKELRNFIRVNPLERIGDAEPWKEIGFRYMGPLTQAQFDIVQESWGRA